MRWEALFDDLQGQWDAAQRADNDARIADLAELEMGRARLADRIRARRGGAIAVRLPDGHDVTGVLLDAAPQWVLIALGERRCLVPLSAIVAAWPLGPVAPEAGMVEQRLGVAHVLRAIAREGPTVRVRTVSGTYRCRLVRVGADHVDLAVDGQAFGQGGAGRVTVTLAAILSVESA